MNPVSESIEYHPKDNNSAYEGDGQQRQIVYVNEIARKNDNPNSKIGLRIAAQA